MRLSFRADADGREVAPSIVVEKDTTTVTRTDEFRAARRSIPKGESDGHAP
jgi:hypothetical protein